MQNTSSETFLAPGVHFYGRARTFMAGRAFLWPGAHFYGRARIFIAGARIFSVKICFLRSGAHFYGRARIFVARARIFAAGIDGAADKATGSVVGGPPKRFGNTKVVPLDAARWHRPRPFNPGTRLDTRLVFL